MFFMYKIPTGSLKNRYEFNAFGVSIVENTCEHVPHAIRLHEACSARSISQIILSS